MLRLPPFAYLRPRTVAEAVETLATHGARARPLAGGTDLLPKMKRRQLQPSYLVAISHLPELRGLEGSAASGLSIGAGEPLARVAIHPEVVAGYPALARAAAAVSTPQLRAMGTLGGNLAVDPRCTYYDQTEEWRESMGSCLKVGGEVCLLAPAGSRCWAVSSSDTAPVLIALGAEVTLEGPAGVRTIPLAELYANDGMAYLTTAPDELITRVHIPPAQGWRSTYLKLRRRGSFDFPILGVAVALRPEDGVVAEVRIVLGAVASRPIRAEGAEALLAGRPPTAELLAEVAQRAGDPAKPLDNTDLTHPWRKRMSRVLVRRALAELTHRPA